MERGIIDRFEGEIAVIEVGKTTREYPRSSLPANARVGDSVIIEAEGSIRVDVTDTKKRKKEIEQLMDELLEYQLQLTSI